MSSTPAATLTVSVGVSPRQPLAAWAKLAGELEEEGVGRIWLVDSQLAMKDVYAGLLLAAQSTRRAQLGPGVTNPLTRHPTVTASAMAALAEVSGGRAILGLGAGDSALYGLGRQPGLRGAGRRRLAHGRPGPQAGPGGRGGGRPPFLHGRPGRGGRGVGGAQ